MQLNVENIADKADMIINGYAFTKDKEYIRVLNLNCINHASVIYSDKIVENNMDGYNSIVGYHFYRFNKSKNILGCI